MDPACRQHLRRRELYGAAPQDFISKTREAILKARDLDDSVAYTQSVLRACGISI